MPVEQSEISKLVESVFNTARSRLPELDKAWVALSHRLSCILSATSDIERTGLLDLVLRNMEDELAVRTQAGAPPDTAYHYQKMFSDIWVGSAYEIVRALAQPSREAVLQPDAKLFNPSVVARLNDLLADLERLREPLEKYASPRDSAPLTPVDGQNNEYVCDPKNPERRHIMPIGISDRGSITWLAFDARTSREDWLERQGLADRFLILVSGPQRERHQPLEWP